MGDHVAIAYSTSSEDDVDDVSIPEETTAPLCDGTPRRLWVGKCMVLHRADGFPIARGICRNVCSDVVVGSTGPLGESHVAIQISSSLSMADVPDECRYLIQAWCRAALLEECPQHHGHKGDPGVTPGTCGAIGERAQVILVWLRAPGRWERLPPTETRSHEGKA